MKIPMAKRLRACLAAGVVLTAAALGGPAAAAGFGGALQPGSTVCTDWLRTDGGGVYLYGWATGSGTFTWTMRMSSAPGGPETVIFRAVTDELIQNVVPPRTGTFYFRNCLAVRNGPAQGYRLQITAGIGQINPVYGIGPHTATLAPGSTACGEFAIGAARLLGASDRVTRWSLRGTSPEYGSMGEIFSVTGAAIDRVFDPGPTVFAMDACATNTAAGTATVSFELLAP